MMDAGAASDIPQKRAILRLLGRRSTQLTKGDSTPGGYHWSDLEYQSRTAMTACAGLSARPTLGVCGRSAQRARAPAASQKSTDTRAPHTRVRSREGHDRQCIRRRRQAAFGGRGGVPGPNRPGTSCAHTTKTRPRNERAARPPLGTNSETLIRRAYSFVSRPDDLATDANQFEKDAVHGSAAPGQHRLE